MTLIICNWKMAITYNEAEAFLTQLHTHLNDAALPPTVQLGLLPPAVMLPMVAERGGSLRQPVLVGAQDCSPHAEGAFTGQLSARQLRQAGARLVVIGHSECRGANPLYDAEIPQRLQRSYEADLSPILCVGEPLSVRQQGTHLAYVTQQLNTAGVVGSQQPCIIAYEPIWAIGTGLRPSHEDIAAMHHHIHQLLASSPGAPAPILYGGSVTGDHASQILQIPHVGGVLVGGASLKWSTLWPIIQAAL